MAHNKKNKANVSKSTNLERLAQGISDNERKDMLSKLKEVTPEEGENIPGVTQKKKRDAVQAEEERREFALKLRKESLLDLAQVHVQRDVRRGDL